MYIYIYIHTTIFVYIATAVVLLNVLARGKGSRRRNQKLMINIGPTVYGLKQRKGYQRKGTNHTAKTWCGTYFRSRLLGITVS